MRGEKDGRFLTALEMISRAYDVAYNNAIKNGMSEIDAMKKAEFFTRELIRAGNANNSKIVSFWDRS